MPTFIVSFLVGKGSPTKIDYRRKGHAYSNLSTGGVKSRNHHSKPPIRGKLNGLSRDGLCFCFQLAKCELVPGQSDELAPLVSFFSPFRMAQMPSGTGSFSGFETLRHVPIVL